MSRRQALLAVFVAACLLTLSAGLVLITKASRDPQPQALPSSPTDRACEELIRAQVASVFADWTDYSDNDDGTVTLHTDDDLTTALQALLVELIRDTPEVCEHLTSNDLVETYTRVMEDANDNMIALICPPCVPASERW